MEEGSRFSTTPSDEEMAQESDSRNQRPLLNRPQLRQKTSSKVGKGKKSKKARRTVISDDDDDDDDADSMPWRSDTADENPPSSPSQTWATTSSSTRTRRGKSRADFENTVPFREDRPVTIGTKRPRPLDLEPTTDSKPPSPPVGLDTTVAAENKEPVPKKKLPPIKKIKLSDSSAMSPAPSSKATAAQAKIEKPRFTVDSGGLPPPPSSLPRKPAATAGNADLDLSNADVYKQLFSASFRLIVYRTWCRCLRCLRRGPHLRNLGLKRRKTECGNYIGCGMRLGWNVSEQRCVLLLFSVSPC